MADGDPWARDYLQSPRVRAACDAARQQHQAWEHGSYGSAPAWAAAAGYDGDRPSTRLQARLMAGQDGATAIEYGLIAALIAVASIVALGGVGTALSSTFQTIAGQL